MTIPTQSPLWSTDSVYPAGSNPWAGQPTRGTPASGQVATGFIPESPIDAEIINSLLGNHGDWITGLFALVLALISANGSDGAVVFDGTTTHAFATLSGGVYTLTRAIFPTTITFSGSASVNNAGFPIIASVSIDTTGTTATGTPSYAFTPGAIGNAGGAGVSPSGSTGGAGGSAGASGMYFGGAPGGAGGTDGATNPGIAGGNTTNSVGGHGGIGGTSSGSSGAGGAAGTVTAPTAVNGAGMDNLLSPATLGTVIGTGGLIGLSAGAGGGGGGASVATPGGGGGGGGGWTVVIAPTITLKTATDLFSPGGNGGVNATNNGCGGGGGGGRLFVGCGTLTIADSSVLTTAACVPGGLCLNSSLGAANGAAGSLRTFVLASMTPADAALGSTHEEYFVASFATGGSGAGYDYVDWTFGQAFNNTSYNISYGLTTTTDTVGAPDVHFTLPTMAGLRIRPDAQFNGDVRVRVRG